METIEKLYLLLSAWGEERSECMTKLESAKFSEGLRIQEDIEHCDIAIEQIRKIIKRLEC